MTDRPDGPIVTANVYGEGTEAVTGAGGVLTESQAPSTPQYEVRAWLRSWGPGADERGYANLAILVTDLREGFAFFSGQAVYGFETRRVE